jgi:hypothetical protein
MYSRDDVAVGGPQYIMKAFIFSGLCRVAVVCLGAGLSFGSTVFSVATNIGQQYTVSTNTFSTTGNDMAGMRISATFSDSSTGFCIWATGTTAGCSATTGNGKFTIGFPGATDTDPAAGALSTSIWTITNNSTANLASLTINGLYNGTMVDFDRCTYAATTGGALQFDDTDTQVAGGTCYSGGSTTGVHAVEGTPGSNVGFSAKGASNGTNPTSSQPMVTYTNRLHLSGQSAVGDIWGEIVLTFGQGTTGAFSSNQTFRFIADTDLLTSAAVDVTPEPATFAVMGFALAGIGLLRLRRNPTR